MRWTEQQYNDYLANVGKPAAPFQLPANQPGWFACGKLPIVKMNKTEAAYDAYLRGRPDVVWHHFEAVKLKLADNTFYTPDFAVLPVDGVLQMREVKGFMRDDAAVKIKVAARLFPFKFILVRKRAGGWEETEI